MLLLNAILLVFWLSTASAVDMPVYISTPSQVAAGIAFEASLSAEVYNGDASWCSFFRVYLGSSYEDKAHYFYNSDCTTTRNVALGSSLTRFSGYLIHEQTLCDASIDVATDHVSFQNTSFSVTVPPTVGPSGEHYVLIARTFQTDGSWYGSSLESNVFDLTGANGTWSQTQKQGYTLWGDDGIACSGFACVKNCSDQTNGPSSNSEASNNTAYDDCANACPNVSIDFENSTQGGQPTASLTTPSPCSVQRSVSATDAATTREVTGAGAIPTATRSRSAAAAAGTSSASCRHETWSFFLMGLISLAVIFLIG